MKATIIAGKFFSSYLILLHTLIKYSHLINVLEIDGDTAGILSILEFHSLKEFDNKVGPV